MSETFTKLFGSILDSSIWSENLATRIVWVTMLAMADRHGYVAASLPGLAVRAGVSLEEAEAAVAKFLAPDRYSRSKDHDGRRIEEVDRGWTLLNYERFRDARDEEARREYERFRKRQQRAETARRAAFCEVPPGPGHVRDSPGQPGTVPVCPVMSAQAEAEAEADPLPPQDLNPQAVSPARVVLADARTHEKTGRCRAQEPPTARTCAAHGRACTGDCAGSPPELDALAELEALALACIPPGTRRGNMQLPAVSVQALCDIVREHGPDRVREALRACGSAERPVEMARARLDRTKRAAAPGGCGDVNDQWAEKLAAAQKRAASKPKGEEHGKGADDAYPEIPF